MLRASERDKEIEKDFCSPGYYLLVKLISLYTTFLSISLCTTSLYSLDHTLQYPLIELVTVSLDYIHSI